MIKTLLTIPIVLASIFSGLLKAQDYFVGQIIFVPYNFEPAGFFHCDGRTLSIAQFPTLYALIGTTYGGNGQTTFDLPNAEGRVIISSGNNYQLGQMGGEDDVALTIAQMPGHNHLLSVSSEPATSNSPVNNFLASTKMLDKEYSTSKNPNEVVNMNVNMIASVGSGVAHDNRMPSVTLKCMIAYQGNFPYFN